MSLCDVQQKPIEIWLTYGIDEDGPCPPCIASVVYGAIFRKAGKRTGVSIFLAEDLSFVLCSNRYGKCQGEDQCNAREICVTLN